MESLSLKLRVLLLFKFPNIRILRTCIKNMLENEIDNLISKFLESFSSSKYVLATLTEKWKINFSCLYSRICFCFCSEKTIFYQNAEFFGQVVQESLKDITAEFFLKVMQHFETSKTQINVNPLVNFYNIWPVKKT